MLPVINRSVRDVRAQLQTGHRDLRSYYPQATVATADHRAATPTSATTARNYKLVIKTSAVIPQATVVATDHTGSSHANSNEPSSSKRAPPGHPAAVSERTYQYGHALI
jgi:hypothetical protein